MSGGVSKNTEGAREPPWLHVRREAFEYGMLPLPSLLHSDVVTGLRNLRVKLLQQAPSISTWPLSITANASHSTPASGGRERVGTEGIAAALEVAEAHAHLVLDTLASVLNEEGAGVDPLAITPVTEIDSVGADIDELLIFLYIQTYRRVPSRPHRGAADVADVWPSTSAIDGFLPALSSMQVRSSTMSRRSMPGQAEEEVNQLTYVQKHLPNLLNLLAETTEDEDSSIKVITAEQFEHLGLLLKAKNADMELVQLSQAAPFFANSDPDMPAAPVPVTQVLEWVQQHMCAASESLRETSLGKEEKVVKDVGPAETLSSEVVDVTMADATASPASPTPSNARTILVPNGVLHLSKDWRPEGMTFVDGIMKASVLKREDDIKGDSVKVAHCHDSVVYVLAPMKYVSVFGCSDSIVMLGAVGKAVRVEYCERVQVIVPTARITIANCRECVFYLGVNQRPLFTGDNHNLQVAPYNTFYPELEAHLAQVGVDATVNRWDRILTLGVVEPHDAFIHPASSPDVQTEGATQLPPEKFVTFSVPNWNKTDSDQLLTRANPFLLPKPYLLAQQHRCKAAEILKQNLRTALLEEGKKRELISAIHGHFRDWLFGTINIF
uniref:TBCC domain-containing protein 1 n=1 Tax=Physcomitrium patens TaxID=3218 RepID=A0A7I4BU15_PHYPA